MLGPDADQLLHITRERPGQWIIHGIVVVPGLHGPDHSVAHAVVHDVDIAGTFGADRRGPLGERVAQGRRTHVDLPHPGV